MTSASPSVQDAYQALRLAPARAVRHIAKAGPGPRRDAWPRDGEPGHLPITPSGRGKIAARDADTSHCH